MRSAGVDWLVGMTYHLLDVTKLLISVSTMCDSGNVVAFNSQGDTIPNLRTTHTKQVGRESRLTPGGMDFAWKAK